MHIASPQKNRAICTAWLRFASIIVCSALLGGTAFAASGEGSSQASSQQAARDEAAHSLPPARGGAQRDESRQREAHPLESRTEEARRAMPDQNRSDAGRRSGRLTPDERRDLRRQINEAGQDLYVNAPRR